MAERLLTAVAAVVLGAVLAGCGGGGGTAAGGVVSEANVEDWDGMHGTVLTSPYTFPDAALVHDSGEKADVLALLDEPLTLVFFGYSMCPDICQAVMADLASTVARLEPAEAEQVQVLFVTTDPARDDPATLRAYLDRFDPQFEGLTGRLGDIVDVATAVHVPVEKGPPLPSGGYEITHGTPILGVQPDGTVPVLWTEGTSAAKLAEDIHKILTDGIPTEDGTG